MSAQKSSFLPGREQGTPLTTMMLGHARDAAPEAPTYELATRAGIIASFIVCSVVVVARFYTRVFVLDCWGWDDSTIAVSWVANLAMVILWSVKLDVGEATQQGMLLQYLVTLTFEVGIFLSQISILLFYLRLLPRGRYWLTTIATLVVVICASIAFVLAGAFQCSFGSGTFPFNPSIACVPTLPLIYAGTAYGTFTDMWIMAIIIPVLLKLQLPLKQKIALVLLMSGGGIVIIAGIIRVVLLRQQLELPIQEWDLSTCLVWSCIQLSVGILCVAIPATVPLLKVLAPQTMANLVGEGSLSNNSGGRMRNRFIRRTNDAIELNYSQDQLVMASLAKTHRSRSQREKGWFTSQRGGHESQDDVLSRAETGRTTKTSEAARSDTRREIQDGWAATERGDGE